MRVVKQREGGIVRRVVSWLQTNFLKTELELGHCLRTPAEGRASATSC